MKSYLRSPATTAMATLFRPAALLLAGAMAIQPLQALVHLNPDPALYETPPATAPGSTLPWDNVGKSTNATGGDISGSVVSLRGKYCLTARHVTLRSHVTFDGVTFYARDTSFTPVNFETTNLSVNNSNYRKPDLMLFKLAEDPNLPELPIPDFSHSSHSYLPLYTVGWGFGNKASGRTETSNGTVWAWSTSTAKRWGTHSAMNANRVRNLEGYYFEALRIFINNTPTLESEAGMADLDSGSGTFTYRDGQWYLAGIASRTTRNGGTSTSRFGFESGGNDTRDSNYYVSLFNMRSAILALLPDTTTFAGWLADYGLSGANAAPDADPDGDGMTNLSEFAFATNPKKHDGASAPALHATPEGGFVFRYQLSKEATGISVDVLHSADVISWSPLPGTPTVVEENARYAVYEVEVFPNTNAERFYTVKVTLD